MSEMDLKMDSGRRSNNSIPAALTAFLNEIPNSSNNVEECSESCWDWVVGDAALVAFLSDGLPQY